MTSEAKIASCRRNGKKSLGPKTPEGRERSSWNAYKHGLRSKKQELIREDSYAFENRKQKWMAKVDPSDDMGEFLAYQTVATWTEIEHAERAIAERTSTLIDTSEDKEIEAASELGRRLFFDRCGPIDLYGNRPDFPTKKEREQKTSSVSKGVDPDDPRKLVAELEKTAFGCIWMRSRWEELLDQVEEPGRFWQSPDRIKSIRLLGRQPAAAATDRTIAEIFVASDALHRSAVSAFDDLLSDMQERQLRRFQKRVKARWPDLFDIDDEDKGRAFLTDLVEQNIERLNELVGEFEKRSNEIARQTIDNLRRDDTPAGHRMRNYLKNSRDALDRRMAKYDKYKEKMKDQDETNPRRIKDEGGKRTGRRQVAEPGTEGTSGLVGSGVGDPRPASPRRRMGLDCWTKGGGMPEEVDLSWAYEQEAQSVDVSDAGTVERGHAGGRGGEENGMSEPAGGPVSLLEDAGGSGGEENGLSELGGGPASLPEEAGGSGGEEDGMSEPGEKNQDFTNEPKSDEGVSGAQFHTIVEVASNSGIELALDNEAIDVRAEDGGRTAEDGELRAEDGGRTAEDGTLRAEGGGRTAEDGTLRAEDGGRTAEDGTLRAEDGGRRTEDGESMASDGRRRAGEGAQTEEDGGQSGVERGEQRSVVASELVEPQVGSPKVGARCEIVEIRKRGSGTRDWTLADAIPASKIQNLKLEKKRRRREAERIERRAIERKVEQALSGKVTSASKLIEDILCPSQKGGRNVQSRRARSP